jgi:hypothetical protein
MAHNVAGQHVMLDWEDDEGNVVVTPRDRDRFVVKIRRAVEMLQAVDRAEQFQNQFKLLMSVLAKWLQSQGDVKHAHLTLRDGGLAFVLVKRSAAYNSSFEDELSELDFQIANDPDLDLIKLDVIALPPTSDEALSSFLDPEFMVSYPAHGHGS